MILLKWLGRVLDQLCRLTCWAQCSCARAASAVYRAYYRSEARKAARQVDLAARERQRRIDMAIEDVIAESRPAKHVRAPIHRDR